MIGDAGTSLPHQLTYYSVARTRGATQCNAGVIFKAALRLKAYLPFSYSCTSTGSLLQGATPGAAVAVSLL